MGAAHEGELTAMRAITISREYGSGGGEVARRLAERLGWKLIDHEVVVEVAKALGVSEAEAEAHDEHAYNAVDRVLYGLSALSFSVGSSTAPVSLRTDSDLYEKARRSVVERATKAGNVVIVGRGSQVLLAGRRDVLHVRTVAPLPRRVDYVVRREGLNPVAARARILAKDRERVRFLQNEHGSDPSDPCLYDLVVNTGDVGVDGTVDLVLLALERKGASLIAPPDEQGPAAGTTPYPSPPGNFTPGTAEEA